MSISEAVRNMIEETNGKIFSIKFIKRTDNSIREMICRTGVTKGLVENPSKPGVDFKEHNLICVWDMKKAGYRSIPIEGIIEIKINGEWIKIK